MSGASTCTATWSKVSIMRDEQERDDHRGAARAQPVAQRHHRAADAGQQIVGQDLAGLGLRLRVPADLLLPEDDRGQRRNVTGLWHDRFPPRTAGAR